MGRAILPAAAFQAARLQIQLVRIPAVALHQITMRHYERRLPHWDVVEHPLFVTFRLHGSLPTGRVFPPGQLTSGKAFVAMDRILDRAVNGPSFLRRPDIAGLVATAFARRGTSVWTLSVACIRHHAESRPCSGDASCCSRSGWAR